MYWCLGAGNIDHSSVVVYWNSYWSAPFADALNGVASTAQTMRNDAVHTSVMSCLQVVPYKTLRVLCS